MNKKTAVSKPGKEKRRGSRISPTQFETMLRFMTDNEHFGRGKLVGLQGRQKQIELWESLNVLLNDDETGPTKDVRLWTKTWNDWKTNTRKKGFQRHKDPSSVTLSAVEKKLLAFLGPAGPEETIPFETFSEESTGETVAEYKLSPSSNILRPTNTNENGAGPSKVVADFSILDCTGEQGPAKRRKRVTEAAAVVQVEQTVLDSIDESISMIAIAMAEMAQAHTTIANALVAFLNKQNQ